MNTAWRSLMALEAPATLGLCQNALDRAASLRRDSAALAALQARSDARAYAVFGDDCVLQRNEDGVAPLFSLAELPLPARELLFLGLDEGSPRYCAVLEGKKPERSDLRLLGLRQLILERALSPSHLGALAQGKAMAFWHSRHRFCGNCGSPSIVAEGGWRRECPRCGGVQFPRTDPVVIMLAIREGFCLLGREARFPPGIHSTLAGFLEPGETIEAAVRRELFEEAGIRTSRVDVVANQPWPFPASLMIGAIATATSERITIEVEELEACRWFSRDELRLMFEKRHPDGLGIPPRMTIAHHLIRLWCEA